MFDRRYRVRADVPKFASAVVDARMMLWLLDLEADVSFELGGHWAVLRRARDGCLSLTELLDALDGFLAHIPRVASSLYPPPDPFA